MLLLSNVAHSQDCTVYEGTQCWQKRRGMTTSLLASNKDVKFLSSSFVEITSDEEGSSKNKKAFMEISYWEYTNHDKQSKSTYFQCRSIFRDSNKSFQQTSSSCYFSNLKNDKGK